MKNLNIEQIFAHSFMLLHVFAQPKLLLIWLLHIFKLKYWTYLYRTASIISFLLTINSLLTGVNECASQCSHLCVGRGVCLCTNGTRVRPGQGCSDAPLLTHSFVTSVTEPPHTTSTLWTMFKVFFIFIVALPAVAIILYIVRNDIVTLFHTFLSAASKPVFSKSVVSL